MQLTLMEFLSLDGVAQGPGAPDEDTSDGFTRGGWLVPHVDDEFLRQVETWMTEADAFLLGRQTWNIFSQAWPKVTDPDDAIAAKLNNLPKYVASRTLRSADDWQHSTILSGDVAAQVAELKQRPGRELQIHGSARLARSMLAAGLVDTLRLVIAPVVVGAGRRLFPDTGEAAGFRLTESRTTPAGLTLQTYTPTGPPTYGTYELNT